MLDDPTLLSEIRDCHKDLVRVESSQDCLGIQFEKPGSVEDIVSVDAVCKLWGNPILDICLSQALYLNFSEALKS